jgi:hypothetical protein
MVLTPGLASPHQAGTGILMTADAGSPGYHYRFWLHNVATSTWTMVQDYSTTSTWILPSSTSAGNYVIAVDARQSTTGNRDAVAYLPYELTMPAATSVTITPNFPSGHAAPVLFSADAGAPGYQYRFWLYNGTAWSMVQDYGVGDSWTMPAGTAPGNYSVAVDARGSASVGRDTVAYLGYQVVTTPASAVTITPSQVPHVSGDVIFTAAGQGATGYDYRFWLYEVATTTWTMVQDYGVGTQWTMLAATTPGSYVVAVDVRSSTDVPRDTVNYLGYQF